MKLTIAQLLEKIYQIRGQQIHDLFKASLSTIPKAHPVKVDHLNQICQHLQLDSEVQVHGIDAGILNVELPWWWRMQFVSHEQYEAFLQTRLDSCKFEFTDSLASSSLSVKDSKTKEHICGWSKYNNTTVYYIVEQ